TSQNHGFALDPKSLKINDYKWQVGEAVNNGDSMIGETDFGRVELTHINLNDGTLEGIRCLDIPAFSVQYHPEASPGPHDSKYLFKEFIELMKNNN
ncbi:MAG: carbamoyl phosphate synthase small subunit, partial [Actinomycetia bacterium]|nr:carbamoyl phosphate synthase small subunit [Actinomycetes bacterium]